MTAALQQLLEAVQAHGSDTKAYEAYGNIHVNLHPNGELLIFNYTPRAAYEGTWTPIERICRGLIIHWPTATVRARAFDKFFNLNQMPETMIGNLPHGQVEITAKMDGSMGLSYWDSEQWAITTRGSFTSPQAIWATQWLHEHVDTSRWTSGETYIFEIIYPENRIVLDYRGFAGLVLIGYRINATGEDYWHNEFKYFAGLDDVRVVERVHSTSLDALLAQAKTLKGTEGWVIRFSNGLRVKIKTDEYLRLHRILTNVTERTIWEYLKDDKSFDDLLDQVPDEFMQWVNATRNRLIRELAVIWVDAFIDALNVLELHDSRADQARWIKAHAKYPGLVFGIMDQKDVTPLIWKMLKPAANKPFAEDEA
jgi:RNA ligase